MRSFKDSFFIRSHLGSNSQRAGVARCIACVGDLCLSFVLCLRALGSCGPHSHDQGCGMAAGAIVAHVAAGVGGMDFAALDEAPRIFAGPDLTATGRRRGQGRPPGKRGTRAERSAIRDAPAGELALMLDSLELKRRRSKEQPTSTVGHAVVASMASPPQTDWIAATDWQRELVAMGKIDSATQGRGTTVKQIVSSYCCDEEGTLKPQAFFFAW